MRKQFCSFVLLSLCLWLNCGLALAQQVGTTRYVYDDNGRLRAVIAPNGEAGIYEYDAAGNIRNIRRNAANQLEIFDFSPRQGLPGTTVKIIGTGFGAGVTRVTFNGTAATSFTTAAPQIMVTLPTGATTGPIVVTTAGGTATSAQPFTVLMPTTGTVQGTVRNAATGAALAGATISITNSTLTTTSNSDGAYTLANVPTGAQTLKASAPGFADTQLALNVIGGQTLTQNISLSPVLITGELRITLNWTKDANGTPRDLDAHLYGPTTNNRCFEVYWSNKGNLSAPPFAALEVDNIRVDGSPPTETIRIAQTMAGTYRFFIDNFSGGAADVLSRSQATVQIYDSNGLLRTYVVPSGTGRYWHVFELNGQTRALTDINILSSSTPPFTCSN